MTPPDNLHSRLTIRVPNSTRDRLGKLTLDLAETLAQERSIPLPASPTIADTARCALELGLDAIDFALLNTSKKQPPQPQPRKPN